MDEAEFLDALRAHPEDEQSRERYFAWLVASQDPRARYVRLMEELWELQAWLAQLEVQIQRFPGISTEWQDVVFPLYVRSPHPGRFYVRPHPDGPPYANVGDVVTAETIFGLVEAWTILYEVKAGRHGVVDEILVPNGGEVVEGGSLIRLKRQPDPLDFW